MTNLSDWAKSLLEARHYGTLATQNADGSLHQTPVWYLFRDGCLYVEAPSSSRKVRNAVARPTASLVVDVRKVGSERWISGSGPVTLLQGEESRRINAAIKERYLTAEAIGHPQIGPMLTMADDATLCIRPAQWRSWAAADVDAQFFGGMLCATPEKWFRPMD